MVAGIQIGLLLSGSRKTTLFNTPGDNTVNEVLSYVQAKYVDTVNVGNLEDGAIEKMLENLDPHSTFIPSKDLREVNQELEGNFEGVGIEFFW